MTLEGLFWIFGQRNVHRFLQGISFHDAHFLEDLLDPRVASLL